MFATVTAWVLLGALPGLLASAVGAGPRTGAVGALAIGAIGGVTAGAVVFLAAGPGTVLADLLGPPAALVGGTVLLANLTRPRPAPAGNQAH